MNSLFHDYVVRQVPLAAGIVVSGQTSLIDVIDQMRQEKTGCAVTEDEGRITGIFTERDFLNKVVEESVDWTKPVSEFATKSPVTMTPEEPLRKALYLMRKKGFRHIPVVDATGTLHGVLSVRNVIKHLADHFPVEVMNLPPRVHDAPSRPEGG